MICRYHHKAPPNWVALTTATLFFVILLLIGYILYGAENHIVKVEDDFHKMEELKVRAEAAYVAKSRGIHTGSGSDLINVYHCPAVVFFFLLSFEKLYNFETFDDLIESLAPLIGVSVRTIAQLSLKFCSTQSLESNTRHQTIQIISWLAKYKFNILINHKLIQPMKTKMILRPIELLQKS
ncbi:unnamed protein product [Vicia faba]|uniref:Uncharacterized protein n=1 Tax=Vicia faba TaxID=3906 RepID=A0AAV1BBH1_VICFA|nr:unnamed protein product [Vicia faba]